MSVEQLLTGSRWQLLQALAKRPQSTSELAKGLGTSQANVSQQLKHLELANIISRRRAPKRKRVHYVYELPDNFTYLVRLAPGLAEKKTLTTTPTEQLLAALLLHDHATALLTFILTKPDYFRKCLAIGALDRNEPQLFILTEHVDEFRTNSNIELETIDGKKEVAIWSHSSDEVADGLERGDQYFHESLRETSVVYDPRGELAAHKARAEEEQ